MPEQIAAESTERGMHMVQPTWLPQLQTKLHGLDAPISQIPLMSAAPQKEGVRPRPAAVLLPIHVHAAQAPSLLLTVRSQKLQHHPGQIAFPGGAADRGDQGPAATAIREAWEEVGMPSGQVQPLGYLDRLDTISGFRVVPVIAQVQGDYALRLCEQEVDEVFHLPLSVAAESSSYHFEKREHNGKQFRLPVLQFHDWRIWGATAIMLWRLSVLMNDSSFSVL
ncbi:MAG: CoA pyrophosphatase [Xanthomonadales bacterium]|nr:CoA pyrophosphatase [Xanthomonadales bacterium]